MTEKKETNVIELAKVYKKIIEKKKVFFKVLSATFVLSCVYIISIPRGYSTACELAPEISNGLGGGTLGSLASSFGFDLSSMETSDAITPLLYPNLMDDNKFVCGLFDVTVTNSEGDLTTTYFDYLKNHQAQPWWGYPIGWVKNLFKSDSSKEGNTCEQDPYYLSKDQDDVANMIRGNVKLSVDKKTGVITISSKDQDPLICRTIADSVSAHLQLFITEYRTNKARIDVDYYQELTKAAKEDYDNARLAYSAFADANVNTILKSYKSKQDALENDMQLKFNTYSVLNTQLQQAINKVQERTPAFTTLKGAEVPVKASSPKRMIFVVGMLFLAFIATTIYQTREELHFKF